MKVVDEVGFGQSVQDLQNSMDRELTKDEQMKIRQSLGLYGEYPKVEVSTTWGGFKEDAELQVQLLPNSPPMYVAEISAEEAGTFFTEAFPKLLAQNFNDWASGKNVPTYEVECDGVKNTAPIWFSPDGDGLAVIFGVSESQFEYWRYGAGEGIVCSAVYSHDNGYTQFTFSGIEVITFMPGYGHKVTLTDVTPGVVNKIPAEYLPENNANTSEPILLTITDAISYSDRYECKISNTDWQKVDNNPGGNFVLVRISPDMHMPTYYYPTSIAYSSNNSAQTIYSVFNKYNDEDGFSLLTLVVGRPNS